MVTIQFCGGAGSVTGANYIVSNGKRKFLVECGMVQGTDEMEAKNREPFPYDPSKMDCLIITHAHTDHMGRVPKLIKDGFKGKIYSTYPTRDFSKISLEDNYFIMHTDQRQFPIYELEHVHQAMKQWEGKEYGDVIELYDDVSIRFRDAGHIMGSSIVEVWIRDHEEKKKKKIVFSGDMGNIPSVLLRQYEYVEDADVVLVESAYGDRIHANNHNRKAVIRQAIKDTIDRKAVCLMPVFSIERTQDILFELNDIIETHTVGEKILGRVGKIDVYLDSPLAIDATEIHSKYPHYYNKEARKLSKEDDLFDFPFLHFCENREQSMAINHAPQPKLIMAGSGMSTGGRILFHEEKYLSDPNNMMIFVGYQAAHTLGRQIQDGEEYVWIRGKKIRNAIETRTVDGYSAHADQNMLVDWIRGFKTLRKVFVVQGEQESSQALAKRITEEVGVDAFVPKELDIITI
jgi:metallo-beta-lactamase family protein